MAPFIGFLRHREFLLRSSSSGALQDPSISTQDPSISLRGAQDPSITIQDPSQDSLVALNRSSQNPSISLRTVQGPSSSQDPSISVTTNIEDPSSSQDPSISLGTIQGPSSSAQDPSISFRDLSQDPSSFKSQDPSTSTQGVKVPLGPTWLFFGCRHPEMDHIYKEEMDHFRAASVLSHLNVAYSQLTLPSAPQGDNKTPPHGNKATPTRHTPSQATESWEGVCYVQDLMMQNWQQLGKWLVEDGGCFYVCG